ncbi:MAG TPA: response regulator [Nitrospirota bacterium]|nr:response regulator [Nitrospirota bacterium]
MKKRKVIIYDDDDAVLNLLKTYFIQRGYEVLAFRRPIVCPFGEFSAQCPQDDACADIMLTDYIMPEMNGVELLMAQSRRKCRMPVANKAIISGFLDEIVLKKLHALGYTCFEKPFDLQELGAWLDEREKAGQ